MMNEFKRLSERLKEAQKISEKERENDRLKEIQEKGEKERRRIREAEEAVKREKERKRQQVYQSRKQTDFITAILLVIYILSLIIIPIMIDTQMAAVYAIIIAIPGFLVINAIGDLIKKLF